MLCLDRAAAHVDRGDVNLLDAEQIERHASADDIGDRIHSTHFVKMNLIYGDSVDACFGLAEPSKYGGGVVAGSLGDGSPINQLQDVAEMAVLMAMSMLVTVSWCAVALGLYRRAYDKFRCRHAAAFGLLDL